MTKTCFKCGAVLPATTESWTVSNAVRDYLAMHGMSRRNEAHLTTHWYTSSDPPKFGEDLIALCGKLVSKAQPVMAVWDGDELGGLVKCRKCDQFGPRQDDRYAAVIQDGEESIAR